LDNVRARDQVTVIEGHGATNDFPRAIEYARHPIAGFDTARRAVRQASHCKLHRSDNHREDGL
jgi:hypothetical protein